MLEQYYRVAEIKFWMLSPCPGRTVPHKICKTVFSGPEEPSEQSGQTSRQKLADNP